MCIQYCLRLQYQILIVSSPHPAVMLTRIVVPLRKQHAGWAGGAVPWPLLLQAVLHDAGTYDKDARTGGCNGSLQFELDRPENKNLLKVASEVDKVKAAIDASEACASPITWADALALTGLVRVNTLLHFTLMREVDPLP